MVKRAKKISSPTSLNEYDRQVWDRLDGIPYPGEHQNLLGHDASLEQLNQTFSSGHMHHAWLITGPRGIGKATLALTFAAHVFSCKNSDIATPDTGSKNTSKFQVSDRVASQIAKGGHPNILHLSRPWDQKTKRFKSTLTIDEIRRTHLFFGTTAGEDNWRICIIDTADDMNVNAANALLKVLEEPPSRTIFLVLCHSPGSILPTIRSRCRHLPIRPLEENDLRDALHSLNCPIDDLDEASRGPLMSLSGGSVRSAIILLQQNGLALVSRFNQILTGTTSSNGVDWPSAHKLADELSRKANEEQYNLLFDVAHNHISQIIHHSAQQSNPQSRENAGEMLSNLARLCEVWEKIENSTTLVDAYNLDKKQVVLNLFSQLEETKIRQ